MRFNRRMQDERISVQVRYRYINLVMFTHRSIKEQMMEWEQIHSEAIYIQDCCVIAEQAMRDGRDDVVADLRRAIRLKLKRLIELAARD